MDSFINFASEYGVHIALAGLAILLTLRMFCDYQKERAKLHLREQQIKEEFEMLNNILPLNHLRLPEKVFAIEFTEENIDKVAALSDCMLYRQMAGKLPEDTDITELETEYLFINDDDEHFYIEFGDWIVCYTDDKNREYHVYDKLEFEKMFSKINI